MNCAKTIIFSSLFLTACSGHNLYFANRTTGNTGTARIITVIGHPSGDIAIALNGKTYTGRWIYMAGGGSIGIGSATAFSGNQTTTATGTMIAAPIQGNGSIIASAPDGSTLHCSYNYSQWNASGVGICQDNKNDIFDLQID